MLFVLRMVWPRVVRRRRRRETRSENGDRMVNVMLRLLMFFEGLIVTRSRDRRSLFGAGCCNSKGRLSTHHPRIFIDDSITANNCIRPHQQNVQNETNTGLSPPTASPKTYNLAALSFLHSPLHAQYITNPSGQTKIAHACGHHHHSSTQPTNHRLAISRASQAT